MMGTNNTKRLFFLCVASAIGWVTFATAFTFSSMSLNRQQYKNCKAATLTAKEYCTTRSDSLLYSSQSVDEEINKNDDLLLLRQFLQKYYPAFYQVLDMNEELWKAIGDTADDAEVGFTVFVPSDEATQALGETKQKQLSDERNMESIRKIAGYHVLSERVDVESLFQAGGIKTVSGEIPIERSISGGFFGVGGKEDGGVTVNQAKILRTKTVGSGLVHEVDNLVSPEILWRYMDQLRIPGSN